MRFFSNKHIFFALIICGFTLLLPVVSRAATRDSDSAESLKPVGKVLFIGDSMTGWMAERLNAYGEKNGFDVATVVWDGSTIKKWADSPRLKSIIDSQNPDAVFISLGMNELFEPNPGKNLASSVDRILDAVGDRPLLWIGPPSWPGKNKGEVLDKWLETRLGDDRYFSSLRLSLPRQSKTNPHPTRAGIIQWIDDVAEWIPRNSSLNFKSLDNPGTNTMTRGKTFIYKRMKESL